ncbi:hypothetical protein ACPW96_00280 [Micromonospora sp. DT81.3]|uniref:hypothetical protein n=1 Tax=Micromonospora sp. DT81.3 TaxID=3416523 RepID=UPI003CECA206
MTTDVTLTADLVCPSGDGLILGSKVTLDLGGHSLIGGRSSGIGVQTSPDSQGGNTIRNGTIEDWETGIFLQDSTFGSMLPHTMSDVDLRSAPIDHFFGNTLLDMTRVTAVDSSVQGQLGGNFAISHSMFTRSPVLVFLATATIRESTLVQSYVSTSAGGEVIIDSSKLDGKGTARLGDISETGITITNSLVKNYAQPISGFWGGVTLTGNKFMNMPNGVLGNISSNIGSDGTSVITGNAFIRSGVALRGNVPMIVEKNIFMFGDVGVEFTLSAGLPDTPPRTAEGSRAVGNVSVKNTGTGIQTDLPGLEVGGNIATKNGGYGIYAPGAVDLGGNIAFGNGIGQCVGVVCTGR